jgi:hypothetical protein
MIMLWVRPGSGIADELADAVEEVAGMEPLDETPALEEEAEEVEDPDDDEATDFTGCVVVVVVVVGDDDVEVE